MSKKSHNKKRNVGIIYEQLVLRLSKALVENDKKTFNETRNILKKHFKKGTELYKEHRLVNSLADIQITQESVVPAILEETKKATWRINKRKLNLEKSKLIRTINEVYGKSFYSTRVKNYRDLATIDLLLSEYKKGPDSDYTSILEYSDKVTKILLREKTSKRLDEMKSPEINSLVVKLMREKFTKAYTKNLSEVQLKLVNEWIVNGQSPALAAELSATRLMCIEAIANYRQNCGNEVLSENLEQVYKNIKETNFQEEISESDILKAMTMHEIINELSGDSDE